MGSGRGLRKKKQQMTKKQTSKSKTKWPKWFHARRPPLPPEKPIEPSPYAVTTRHNRRILTTVETDCCIDKDTLKEMVDAVDCGQVLNLVVEVPEDSYAYASASIVVCDVLKVPTPKKEYDRQIEAYKKEMEKYDIQLAEYKEQASEWPILYDQWRREQKEKEKSDMQKRFKEVQKEYQRLSKKLGHS